jgi:hypothetical protein
MKSAEDSSLTNNVAFLSLFLDAEFPFEIKDTFTKGPEVVFNPLASTQLIAKLFSPKNQFEITLSAFVLHYQSEKRVFVPKDFAYMEFWRDSFGFLSQLHADGWNVDKALELFLKGCKSNPFDTETQMRMLAIDPNPQIALNILNESSHSYGSTYNVSEFDGKRFFHTQIPLLETYLVKRL